MAASAREIARQGALHLSSLVKPSGRFVYAYDAVTNWPAEGYNVLRHAGAVWSLFHVSRLCATPPSVSTLAERALEHLVERYVRPFGSSGLLCVTAKDKVKLGGGALAILALLEAPAGPLQAERLATAQALGHYLLSQEAEGDFVHKRSYATGAPSDFRSAYYTGEALFALARLHDCDPAGPWLGRALALAERLARRDYGLREQSHWMLYALDALHRHRDFAWIAHYAARIAGDIEARPDYRAWDRATPIACRSEGLLAFLRLAGRHQGEPLAIAPSRVLQTIAENLALQARYRTVLGGFIRGAGSQEVRIDYIQHNISAFADFAEAVTPAQRPPAP